MNQFFFKFALKMTLKNLFKPQNEKFNINEYNAVIFKY